MIIKTLFIIFFFNLAGSHPYLNSEYEKCGQMNKEGFYEWNKLMHWCGHFLAVGLKQICKGAYNYIDSTDSNHRFQKSKNDTGIVDECCHNCCSALDLKLYCSDTGPDNRKLYIPSAENDDKIYEIYE